ncbi:MAG: tetratricopeptide repeat protein [Bacteroidota bacterium]
MKIYDLSNSNSNFRITDEDRLWVEENFRWLKQVFGYPNKLEEQVLLTPRFFPATFSTPSVAVDNVITDLCQLFGIPRHLVSYETRSDLRDFNNIPYQIEGRPFECEAELKKGQYKIFVANSLQKHPERLIYSLIYEFVCMRLTESDLEFDVGGDDTGLFIYLAGIYYGFGVILAQNLLHHGRTSYGMWEIKWNYGSDMPQQVMAFSLATYANLRGEQDPVWKNEFDSTFKKMLEDALSYLHANPNELYDEVEVKANDLFNQANEYFEKNDLDEAIATLQKILFLTNDAHLKADAYNNMGYYYLRRSDYQQGISNFRKALALGAEYGFANDNLGYALIMTGALDEGLSYVEKAEQTGNNDPAYTFRNFALYHQRKKQFDLAEEFFQKSFGRNTPVDLLEYHYGEFLLEQGKVEQAKTFFQKSAEKNEAEGAHKLRELAQII